jgi:tetratricopeptide (TPR) repeat protein
MKAVELVKERMDQKGFTDIDFDRLMDDLDACSQEYLLKPPLGGKLLLSTGWFLMKNGSYQLAYAIMTKEIERDPKVGLRNIGNRAFCLLHLDRPEEALLDFLKWIELDPIAVSGYVGAGIAYWWLNKTSKAIETWKSGLHVKYQDAAGGVEVPALLYFAATILADPRLEKQSIALLNKKWNTKRVKVWPGPIAGYLLGKISERVFTNYGKIQNPILLTRRLTKIHFWIGVTSYRQGNIQEYQNRLKQSFLGNFIEPEYYLAKCELDKLVKGRP